MRRIEVATTVYTIAGEQEWFVKVNRRDYRLLLRVARAVDGYLNKPYQKVTLEHLIAAVDALNKPVRK